MVKANFLGFEVNKKKKFLEININKTFLIRADIKKDDTLLKILRFLSSDKRKIQDILRRISINQEIIFQERIFVENNAKNCSSIFSDLKG